MDEILIEEKKYISSKQAAKVTGYAKDYIGQLCREGRVPARLVGRSWYVLETAIRDHRFGDQKTEQEIQSEHHPASDLPAESQASVFSSTWESPRYEASTPKTLHSINRLLDVESPEPVDDVIENPHEESESSQHLQASWKAWFDHATDTKPAFDIIAVATSPEGREIEQEATSIVIAHDDDETEVKTEEAAEKEENVPIYSMYNQPPEELLPRYASRISTPHKQYSQKVPPQASQEGDMTRRAIQIIGVLIAVVAISIAILGSGYLDEYVLSYNQASVISGIILYTK